MRLTPVGNFVAETVVKTLSHGLHGTQRRNQSYASMLCSARHRPQRWPMTDADYAWASSELGHNRASRQTIPSDITLQLQQVSLEVETPELGQQWLKDDKLVEKEASDSSDEEEGNDDSG